MARPEGSKNIATFEFAKKFDKLSKTFTDPLELLFKIVHGKCDGVGDWGKAHRLEASKALMQYRYPKLKAVEVIDDREKQPQLIGWEIDGSTADSNTLQAKNLPTHTTQ